MSHHVLRQALQTSLESQVSQEDVEGNLQELRAEAVAVQPPIGAVAEIVAEAQQGNDMGNAMRDIGAAAAAGAAAIDASGTTPAEGVAPRDTLSAESLDFALGAVMRSHGIRYRGLGLESATDKKVAFESIGARAHQVSATTLATTRASMEASFNEVVKKAGATGDFTDKAKTVLGQAISKITAKQKDLEANPVTLNHGGIYEFLQYDGAAVTDLGGVMKRDLDSIKKMLDTHKKIVAFYDKLANLAKDIKGDGQKELNAFLTALVSFDVSKELQPLIGMKLLANGVVNKERTEAYDEDDTSPSRTILAVDYLRANGDGSKATLGEKVKGGVKGAALVGSLGGVFGAAVGAGVGGAFGLVIGGLMGGAMGVGSAKGNAQGRNTYSQTSVKDVIEFLKGAQAMAEQYKEEKRLITEIEEDSAKVNEFFNMFASFITSDANATSELIGLVGKLTGVSDSNGDVKGRVARMQDIVRDKVDAIYAAHMSLVEIMSYHTWLCATCAVEISDALLKSTKA